MSCLLKSLPSWDQGTLPRKFLQGECNGIERTDGRGEEGGPATEGATAEFAVARADASVQRHSSV